MKTKKPSLNRGGFYFYINTYIRLTKIKEKIMAIQVVKQIEDNLVVYVNGGTIVDSSTPNHFTFSEADSGWGLDVDGWDKAKFTHDTLADDYSFPAGFACYEYTLENDVMTEVPAE